MYIILIFNKLKSEIKIQKQHKQVILKVESSYKLE